MRVTNLSTDCLGAITITCFAQWMHVNKHMCVSLPATIHPTDSDIQLGNLRFVAELKLSLESNSLESNRFQY